MSEWSDDIEGAPHGELVLGFVANTEPVSVNEFLHGVNEADAFLRGYMVVGWVIFPKSKRLTRKDGTYNFKARDHKGTPYIATHWRLLPTGPTREKKG